MLLASQPVHAQGYFGAQSPISDSLPPSGQPAWVFIPRLGIDEMLTDNVLQTSSDRKSDLINVITPGISIQGDTARVKLVLDYAPSVQRYVHETDQNRVDQNLFASGLATLVPDLFFFDAHASMAPASRVGGIGTTSPQLIPQGQSTQTAAISASPYLQSNIGTLAQAELRYTFSGSFFSGHTGALTAGNATIGPLSNSTQQEGLFRLGTGEDFGRLHSALVADTQRISGSGANTSSQNNYVELDNEYAISREFFAILQGGYEDLTYPGNSQLDSRGAIWAVGGRWQPTADASISLTYGRRYNGSNINGNLNYLIGAVTHLTASYTENIQTTQQAIIQNLGQAGLGSGGTTVNPGTGLPITVVNPNFPLQNDIFRTRTFQAGISTGFDKDQFTLTAFNEERISLTGATSNDTTRGGTLNWNREIDPRTTAFAQVSYTRDTNFSQRSFDVSLALRYVFTDSVSGGIRYDYIYQSANTVAFAIPQTVGGLNYTQNVLTFSLRKTF